MTTERITCPCTTDTTVARHVCRRCGGTGERHDTFLRREVPCDGCDGPATGAGPDCFACAGRGFWEWTPIGHCAACEETHYAEVPHRCKAEVRAVYDRVAATPGSNLARFAVLWGKYNVDPEIAGMIACGR